MRIRLRHAFIAAVFVVALPATASAADLNCGDFGTRERAQHEIDSTGRDRHGLDGDADGRACEGNPSTGWIPWPVAGIVAYVGTVRWSRHLAAQDPSD